MFQYCVSAFNKLTVVATLQYFVVYVEFKPVLFTNELPCIGATCYFNLSYIRLCGPNSRFNGSSGYNQLENGKEST